MTGHLIDCRSYEGMSGAPCFWQTYRATLRDDRLHDGIAAELVPETRFLGLINSHFDGERKQFDADGRPVVVPHHTGVAVVTPAEALIDLLREDEMVGQRQLEDAAVKRGEIAATLDTE